MMQASTTDRRNFLFKSAGGALSLLLARQAELFARGEQERGPAEACILVWLRGGASQLDTFDPKPGTSTGGPTRAIKTAIRGVQFAEHLPGLAQRADKLGVLRSLRSREGDHARASYLLHTGFLPSSTIRYPGWGSVLSAELPGSSNVPAFVTLGRQGVGPGYRDIAHAAFEIRGGGGVLRPVAGLDSTRRQERLDLLRELEAPFVRRKKLSKGERGGGSARIDAYQRAAELLEGPLKTALQVSDESGPLRKQYGQSQIGRALIGARRLVEAGVRCVEIDFGGWDDHQDIFTNLPGRCRSLDQGLSALLDDLEGRGLLRKTLVVCLGEFGRTPDINSRGGRDHYPRAFSAVLAGGGVKGGTVVGRTSQDGREVVERPIAVPDFFATLATLCGLDPKAERYAGERPVTLVDKGKPIRELLVT